MWFRNLKKQLAARDFRGLYSPTQFRNALVRERARADRADHTLSLLTLGGAESDRSQATLRQVARHLRRRMRLTDEAGWFDARHIGVLLPNTSTEGAWALADKICSEFPVHVPRPECRVYTYPSDWFLGDGEHKAESRHSGTARHGHSEALEPLFFQGLPIWKRSLDIFGAGLGLLAILPVMILLALSVKLTSRGPIFFRQARVGLGGRHFGMFKFRTMVVNAELLKGELDDLNEQDGPVFKIKKDPRITLVGRFLRKSSLDELPQLWNVIRGDMSLVGPRPPLHSEVVQYEPWQRGRLDVTPGLTCIWQVRGRSQVTFTEWMRMDLQYVTQRSLWCDIKLLLETIPAIVTGRGAC